MSGCADYQKNFFLKEFTHFVSAGGLALSVGEIMLKSETALYHFCTINSIFKKYLRFSFDSPSYIKQNNIMVKHMLGVAILILLNYIPFLKQPSF